MRLNRQVENLLNMNRLETGILLLRRDWCDINEMIFTVIQKFNESACEHELIFHPTESFPLVKIDSIVKGFVEAHGGKIDLENKAEGGVLIQLTLPVEATFISQLKNE